MTLAVQQEINAIVRQWLRGRGRLTDQDRARDSAAAWQTQRARDQKTVNRALATLRQCAEVWVRKSADHRALTQQLTRVRGIFDSAFRWYDIPAEKRPRHRLAGFSLREAFSGTRARHQLSTVALATDLVTRIGPRLTPADRHALFTTYEPDEARQSARTIADAKKQTIRHLADRL